VKFSVVAADVTSLGDRWLRGAVQKGLIVPIPGAQDALWYTSLPDSQAQGENLGSK